MVECCCWCMAVHVVVGYFFVLPLTPCCTCGAGAVCLGLAGSDSQAEEGAFIHEIPMEVSLCHEQH